MNNGEILSILQIILLKNYWSIDIALLLDSCPLHNPLHTVALHITTIAIYLVEYNSHSGIKVSMARRACALYATTFHNTFVKFQPS